MFSLLYTQYSVSWFEISSLEKCRILLKPNLGAGYRVTKFKNLLLWVLYQKLQLLFYNTVYDLIPLYECEIEWMNVPWMLYRDFWWLYLYSNCYWINVNEKYIYHVCCGYFYCNFNAQITINALGQSLLVALFHET